MILPDYEKDIDLKTQGKSEELSGKLDKDSSEDKLMSSVVKNDKKTIDDGRMIADAINNGFGAFTPDMIYESIVKNYKMTRKLMGERLLSAVSGYDAKYVERNKNIPEFQDELKKNIKSKINQLKRDKLLDKEGDITDLGIRLSAITTFLEEIENLESKGLIGEKENKKRSEYGEKGSIKEFKKDPYRNIDIRASVKQAIRRSHENIIKEDLKAVERKAKGRIQIIYALDSSASMKGRKIEMAKKAGIGLAYKAIEDKNKVGLIVFGDEIKTELAPTHDFDMILDRISRIKASNQTNISRTLDRAFELFEDMDGTNHLILLTDAMPTEGENPEEMTLESCAKANAAGITISIVGIDLNREGESLAQKMAEIGGGRLHIVKDIGELDVILLEDYYQENAKEGR